MNMDWKWFGLWQSRITRRTYHKPPERLEYVEEVEMRLTSQSGMNCSYDQPVCRQSCAEVCWVARVVS